MDKQKQRNKQFVKRDFIESTRQKSQMHHIYFDKKMDVCADVQPLYQ